MELKAEPNVVLTSGELDSSILTLCLLTRAHTYLKKVSQTLHLFLWSIILIIQLIHFFPRESHVVLNQLIICHHFSLVVLKCNSLMTYKGSILRIYPPSLSQPSGDSSYASNTQLPPHLRSHGLLKTIKSLPPHLKCRFNQPKDLCIKYRELGIIGLLDLFVMHYTNS